MSYVRCIFSASKDMTINIKLFPIYSNSYGHAYDAMFAHDIAATFPSDRVRVCGEFRRHSLCVCVLCGDGVSVGHSQGAATANFLAGVSVGRSQGAANAFRWKAFRLMRPHAFLVSVL